MQLFQHNRFRQYRKIKKSKTREGGKWHRVAIYGTYLYGSLPDSTNPSRRRGVPNQLSDVRIYFVLAVALLQAAPGAAEEAASAIKAPTPFGQTCAVCHGGDAEGTGRAPALLGNRALRGKSDADIAARSSATWSRSGMSS